MELDQYALYLFSALCCQIFLIGRFVISALRLIIKFSVKRYYPEVSIGIELSNDDTTDTVFFKYDIIIINNEVQINSKANL